MIRFHDNQGKQSIARTPLSTVLSICGAEFDFVRWEQYEYDGRRAVFTKVDCVDLTTSIDRFYQFLPGIDHLK